MRETAAAEAGERIASEAAEHERDLARIAEALPAEQQQVERTEAVRKYTEKLRQQPALKNVVLVAITGYGRDSDRQRSREAGFDHHLVKPVRYEQMQQILATVSEKAT